MYQERTVLLDNQRVLTKHELDGICNQLAGIDNDDEYFDTISTIHKHHFPSLSQAAFSGQVNRALHQYRDDRDHTEDREDTQTAGREDRDLVRVEGVAQEQDHREDRDLVRVEDPIETLEDRDLRDHREDRNTPLTVSDNHHFSIVKSLVDYLKRYVILQDESSYWMIAAWIIHTYATPKFRDSPRLSIESPEQACGKTTLLDIIGATVHNPKRSDNVTPSVLFRLIDRDHPTVLIDEADSIWNNKASDDLRIVINGGFSPNGSIDRVNPNDVNDLQTFSTYAAVCMAGISVLHKAPDTVKSRSIKLTLARSINDVEDLELEDDEPFLSDLRTAFGDIVDLIPHHPKPATGLTQRNRRKWTPLFAVAQVCGFTDKIIDATAVHSDGRSQDWNNIILAACKSVFDRYTVDIMGAQELSNKVPLEDERIDDMSPKRLANILSHYDIKSRDGVGHTKQYHRSSFEQAWATYLPHG